MDDAVLDLAADGANRSVRLRERILVRRQQMQWEALRRELFDRELDQVVENWWNPEAQSVLRGLVERLASKKPK